MANIVIVLSMMCLTLCCVDSASNARVLIIPMYIKSHGVGLGKVADVLAASGLDVTVLLPSCDKPPSGVKVKTIPVTMTREQFAAVGLEMVQKAVTEGFDISMFRGVGRMLADICADMFRNTSELAEFNRENKFDLAFVDSNNACGMLFVEFFNLPFINFAFTTAEENQWHAPQPVSYVPVSMSGYSDKMSFTERLKNTVIYLTADILKELLYFAPFREIQRQHNISPELSIGDIGSKARLWLWSSDFAIEFARPLMPHIIPIGSFTAEKVKPLSKELEDWIKGSRDHGIVVFSMGSQLKDMGVNLTRTIASALSRLPQRIVWRHDGETPNTLGANTKIIKKWMPQNDLLANRKTRLFVTHGGANGVHEGLYHGVPMLCLPVYGDHQDNAIRIVAKGIGKYIDYKTMTSYSLHRAMNDIITDERFTKKARKLSAISRDKPMTAEEAVVYWVNYVLKHGTDHLISQVPNLTWYQYYLLDVAALLLVVVLVICYVINKIFSLLCGLCCRKTKKRKKKKVPTATLR